MPKLPELKYHRLSGDENFRSGSDPLEVSVLDFWQWSASSLAANNLRGHLAEFLVTNELGLAHGVRYEWDDCDINTPLGLRIEVKSASYIQQWEQAKHSKISFGIAPTHGWDWEKQARTKTKKRNSDAYVFCLIETKDQDCFNPLDVEQWVFFVVSTSEIDKQLGPQKTMSLSTLQRLSHVECRYGGIGDALCKSLGVRAL